jgi:hypothetical protein
MDAGKPVVENLVQEEPLMTRNLMPELLPPVSGIAEAHDLLPSAMESSFFGGTPSLDGLWVNPATGLPMANESMDVAGNIFGTDSNHFDTGFGDFGGSGFGGSGFGGSDFGGSDFGGSGFGNDW